MSTLGLPSSTISTIVDDPTILGARTSASSSTLTSLGLSPETAQTILGAYIRGFRTVFILNASLNAVATIAAVLLIKHTELTRGDEETLKKAALEQEEKRTVFDSRAHSVIGVNATDEKLPEGRHGSDV